MNITPAMLRAALTGEAPLADATPRGIEASEKRSQQELVASTLMPLKLGGLRDNQRPMFEAAGFAFGDAVDEVFQSATLPLGWTRKATDHSMHSDILDGRGRRRVEVFYKAAFYDRRADARLLPRFRVGTEYGSDHKPLAVVVFDAGEIVRRWPLPPEPEGRWTREYSDACDAVEKEAREWLAKERPEQDDPLAYWDEA